MRISALARLSYLTTKFENSQKRQETVGEHTNRAEQRHENNQVDNSTRSEQSLESGTRHTKRRMRYQEELALLLQQQQENKPIGEMEQPVTNSAQELGATTPESSEVQDLKSLALQYVQQYSKNADIKLSAEEVEVRAEEVYQFYSQSSRAGRLEKIVFA